MIGTTKKPAEVLRELKETVEVLRDLSKLERTRSRQWMKEATRLQRKVIKLQDELEERK